MLMIYTAPTASAGGNGSICKGQLYPLTNATALAYNTIEWTSAGDGTFDNPAIVNPTYTPGAQDITVGSVKLKFKVNGSMACPMANDSLLLTIHGIPQVDLGKDTATCANAVVVLNATHPDAAGYLWLPSMKTTPTITVDSAGIGLHSGKVNVFVTDQNGCVGKDSVLITFKVCGAIEELPGVSVQVFPNPNSGIFTLEVRSLKQQKLDVAIMSPSGETVFTSRGLEVNGVSSEKIDVSRMAQGTYILKVSNGSGSLLRKIVIQK
jgi:hypothetical protein